VRCLLQSIESFGPWFESKIPLYYERSNLHQALLSALERAEGFSPVPYITDLLNGQRNTIIVRGISTLSKIGCKQAIKTIGNYLLAFKSIYVRRNAAEYLGETGHESALEFLEAALMDASPGVRQSSLRSIAQIHAVQHSW
jgi:HEAT repeat protein